MTEGRNPKRGPVSPAEAGSTAESLSDDNLLAIFLKLNIQDPTSDPETHHQLNAIKSELRERGLEEEAVRLAAESSRTYRRPP
jgi:hypothetical protein